MSKTGPGNVAAGPVLVPSLGPDIGHCAAYALDDLCPGPQQLLFGALQIILCVYSPASSTFLQTGLLASRAYPHLSTKSALQSSTFYCNKSPKSLFYTFSTAVIASLRAQAPFSSLPSMNRSLFACK